MLLATIAKQERLLEYLIEQGADVNETASNGRTALQIAINVEYLKEAELLLNKGIDVNHADNKGDAALHDIIMLTRDMKEEPLLPLIALAIQKGSKWDIPNKEGITAKDWPPK